MSNLFLTQGWLPYVVVVTVVVSAVLIYTALQGSTEQPEIRDVRQIPSSAIPAGQTSAEDTEQEDAVSLPIEKKQIIQQPIPKSDVPQKVGTLYVVAGGVEDAGRVMVE